MSWLDSHCHINDKAFRDDLDAVLENMANNDVLKAMIISSYPDDYDYGLTIKHDKIAFKHSLGVYPGDVNDLDEDKYAEYVRRCKEAECVAIGEIGLDYYWDKDNKERQKEIF